MSYGMQATGAGKRMECLTGGAQATSRCLWVLYPGPSRRIPLSVSSTKEETECYDTNIKAIHGATET
ncbi:unnamed protein product [Clonostachys solani]|uniref:Uncharacterized protein n=1 Tax=Clonostachys solani TaxID=160281 RepID=A0A9P0ERA2_9HYPO|nr:unnamed protein product [Clonostachys solani]